VCFRRQNLPSAPRRGEGADARTVCAPRVASSHVDQLVADFTLEVVQRTLGRAHQRDVDAHGSQNDLGLPLLSARRAHSHPARLLPNERWGAGFREV
jgi:hypothetical protein